MGEHDQSPSGQVATIWRLIVALRAKWPNLTKQAPVYLAVFFSLLIALLVYWLSSTLNVVDLWKTISVGVTGAFGMLGLLTTFRDEQTRRVTKWGRLSLAGIITSTMVGMAAQFKEGYDKEQQDRQLASDTLALAKKTDIAVQNVERLLSPLDEIRMNIKLALHCDDEYFKSFCSSVISRSLQFRDAYDDNQNSTTDNGAVDATGSNWHFIPAPDPANRPSKLTAENIGDFMQQNGKTTPLNARMKSSSTWWSAWPNWPIGQNVIIAFDIGIYNKSTKEVMGHPNLQASLVGTTLQSDDLLEGEYDFESKTLSISIRGPVEHVTRDDTMVSLLDLKKATLVIYETNQDLLGHATISAFSISTNKGAGTSLDVSQFHPIRSSHFAQTYAYVFP